jgi:hypothetical protein
MAARYVIGLKVQNTDTNPRDAGKKNLKSTKVNPIDGKKADWEWRGRLVRIDTKSSGGYDGS